MYFDGFKAGGVSAHFTRVLVSDEISVNCDLSAIWIFFFRMEGTDSACIDDSAAGWDLVLVGVFDVTR